MTTPPPNSATPSAPSAAGDRTRRAVLGDPHVDRAHAAATPFTADFQEFITSYAWGAVWSRPGLNRHTRRLLTIAVLTALQCEHELVMHVRAALEDDVTPDEIKEVLLHTAIYAGLPAANRAFGLAADLIPDEHAG
ncbi:4-carboxymuconolactone decarboxylase [Phytoactinopolyspora limicola]|uniref:4-carboxymuconolactone decarboxylase n=1 Tax=Phytoactinopolyspora limicola TaxID=2715536 RepID=UPI00140E0A7D|nr:4-carboxymuconolactone decarboxylase [Phytoactinopolyspora limicola]